MATVEFTCSVAMGCDASNAFEDAGTLFDEDFDTGCEPICPCSFGAQVDGKAGREGDHDAGIVRHGFQSRFALNCCAHHIEGR